MKCRGMEKNVYIKYRSTLIILREIKAICSSEEMLTAAKKKEKTVISKGD